MVDFPDPVFPNIASVSPGFTLNEIFLSAVILVSEYVNERLLNSITPLIFVSVSTQFSIAGFSFKNSLILF